MIVEEGVVTAIESSGVWLSTQKQSACQSCRARAGCGQKALNRWAGEEFEIFAELPPHLKSEQMQVGSSIRVGIEEGAVVSGSMIAYGIPLGCLMSAVFLSEFFQIESAVASLVMVVASLIGAVFIVRKILKRHASRRKCYHPVVIERVLGAAATESTSEKVLHL